VASFLTNNTTLLPDKIKLVYGGQLYPGTDEVLMALNDMLLSLKNNHLDIYNLLEIDFYVPEIDKKRFFLEHPKTVNFYNPIGNKIMSKIAEATFCLIFLAEHNKDFKTTKFLEYSVLRKPFIVLGAKGHVAHFVEENKLGKAYDHSSVLKLTELLCSYKKYLGTEYKEDYDFSEYEFETVTQKLTLLFK
jgi:hypothetical protein